MKSLEFDTTAFEDLAWWIEQDQGNSSLPSPAGGRGEGAVTLSLQAIRVEPMESANLMRNALTVMSRIIFTLPPLRDKSTPRRGTAFHSGSNATPTGC